MRNIQKVLELWGGWAAADNSGVDYPTIAAGFKGILPQTSKTRPACTDEDALIIEKCLSSLKKMRPNEHSLIVAYYFFQIPKRSIARRLKKDERLIRMEIQLGEGFINGCLAMLNVRLDMD